MLKHARTTITSILFACSLSVAGIDTGIVGGTLPNWEAFPQRTKKRAGNAVKRVIAS
jgi:hypothetical protein